MRPEDITAVATVTLVLVGIAAIVFAPKGIKDQLWIMVFAEYTKRYDIIMEELPFEARRPGGDFDVDRLQPTERSRVLGTVRRYLNLCSEELYLFKCGKLDRQTWSIWETGMRDTMRLPGFKGAWNLLRIEYDYYPQFTEFMDSLVASHQDLA